MATNKKRSPLNGEQDVIRTQRIELVDENGKVRITLDGRGYCPCISLLDEDGSLSGSLGLLPSGRPALMFFTGYMPRVNLRLENDGNPTLSMIDEDMMTRA